MQGNFENLTWLHSIGLEELISANPVDPVQERLDREIFSGQKEIKLKPIEKLRNHKKDEKLGLKKISEQASVIAEIADLEKYFRKILTYELGLDGKKALLSSGARVKHNGIIITETPLTTDYARGDLYSGKKKIILENIILSFKRSLIEKDFEFILAPVLPFPAYLISDIEEFQLYFSEYLKNVIRIIDPVYVVFIGERANDFISNAFNREAKSDSLGQRNFLSIPELEYVLNIPVAKKKVWEKWKNIRTSI